MKTSMIELAKVLDLADFVADNQVVTALDVAKEFRCTIEDASRLLNSLPLDPGEGVGCFALKDTVEDFLKDADGEQLLSDRIAKLTPADGADFRKRVLDGIVDLHAKLHLIDQKVDEMANGKTNKKRRRRGELLEPRLDDTPELREIRRQAQVEIAQAAQAGDRKVQQATYQRWYQRIKAAEKRAGIGAVEEDAADAEPASESCSA